MEKAGKTDSLSSSPPIQPTNTNANAPKMATDQEEVVIHVITQPTSSPEPSSLARRGKKLGQVTQDPLIIVMINQYCPNLKKKPVRLAAEHLSGFAKFCEINKSTYETGASIWPIFLLSILGLGEDETMRNNMEEVSQEDVRAICDELYTHKTDYENKEMKYVYLKLAFFSAKSHCNTFLMFLFKSNLIDTNAIKQGRINPSDCQMFVRDFQWFVQRAAREGKDVKCLIDSGLLEIDTINDMLKDAIQDRHEDLIKPLLAAGATNITSALISAVSEGQINTVKALVESGASIDATHGNTTVLSAAINSDSENPDYINIVKFILQQLKQKGINIYDEVIYPSDHKVTPILEATAIVHMLGFTPQHVQIIKMLLEHGANVNINARGIANQTALMQVMQYHPDVIEYHGGGWEIIKLLVDSGATLTADDYKILEQNSRYPEYTLRMYNFVKELLSKKEGSSNYDVCTEEEGGTETQRRREE